MNWFIFDIETQFSDHLLCRYRVVHLKVSCFFLFDGSFATIQSYTKRTIYVPNIVCKIPIKNIIRQICGKTRSLSPASESRKPYTFPPCLSSNDFIDEIYILVLECPLKRTNPRRTRYILCRFRGFVHLQTP